MGNRAVMRLTDPTSISMVPPSFFFLAFAYCPLSVLCRGARCLLTCLLTVAVGVSHPTRARLPLLGGVLDELG